eukprot:SAG31_NODE_4618_length_3092_cov_2.884731_1_plen_91_part_00
MKSGWIDPVVQGAPFLLAISIARSELQSQQWARPAGLDSYIRNSKNRRRAGRSSARRALAAGGAGRRRPNSNFRRRCDQRLHGARRVTLN